MERADRCGKLRDKPAGTAEEDAEKLECETSAPKGDVETATLAARLKACPDTNREFSAACEAAPFRKPFMKPTVSIRRERTTILLASPL